MITSSWLSARFMSVIGMFCGLGLVIIPTGAGLCSVAMEMDDGTTVISSADSAVRKSLNMVEMGGGGGLFSGGGFGLPCSSLTSLCMSRQ